MENSPTFGLAETLLAVTNAACASVLDGDWEMAGRLLRRREQLLTQLEGCTDIQTAQPVLDTILTAETELDKAMEVATREGLQGGVTELIRRAG
jgi:hypothetical protein